MKEPSLSAILPAYNREATLARAIESALGQTFPPDEVIVVDDGSTDGTRDVIAGFGADVRCVAQPNAGAAAARNTGAREASHEWIAFLDSDDCWFDTHLARIGAAIHNTHERADLYFSDMLRTEAEDGERLWELCGFEIEFEYELAIDAAAWAMLPRQPMMLQSSVIRRSVYLAGGMLPELKRRHDTHLFFRLCLGRPVCAVAGVATRLGAGGSAVFDADTRAGWEETELLYRDLLAGSYPLSQPHRRELVARLAAAYLRLARHDWNEKRRLGAVGRVTRAFVTSPRRALARLGRRPHA